MKGIFFSGKSVDRSAGNLKPHPSLKASGIVLEDVKRDLGFKDDGSFENKELQAIADCEKANQKKRAQYIVEEFLSSFAMDTVPGQTSTTRCGKKYKSYFMQLLSEKEREYVTNYAAERVQDFAESNDPHLQYLAGLFYFDGIGVEKNRSEAARCFEKSSVVAGDPGYAPAQYHLGLMYIIGSDSSIHSAGYAVKLFEDAAKLNFLPAVAKLAHFHSKGIGCVVADQEVAKRFYDILDGVDIMDTNISNDIRYQIALHKREGDPASKKQALDILEEIAPQKPEAYSRIGEIYGKGGYAVSDGSTSGPNLNKAQESYQKGIRVGDIDSMKNYAEFLERRQIDLGVQDLVIDSRVQTSRRLADVFEQFTQHSGYDKNKKIKVKKTNLQGVTVGEYTISESRHKNGGNGFMVSIDGKGQEGFKIYANGLFTTFHNGRESMESGGLVNNGLLAEVMKIVRVNNEERNIQNTTGLDPDQIHLLVKKVTKTLGGEHKAEAAKGIVYDFLGISKCKKGENISENRGAYNIEYYYSDGLVRADNCGVVIDRLKKFAEDNLPLFRNDYHLHIRSLAGSFYERGFVGNAVDLNEAKKCYDSSDDYKPSQFGSAECVRKSALRGQMVEMLDITSSTVALGQRFVGLEEALTKHKKLIAKEYLPSLKAASDMIVANDNCETNSKKRLANSFDEEQKKNHALFSALVWLKDGNDAVVTVSSINNRLTQAIRYHVSDYDFKDGSFLISELGKNDRRTDKGFKVSRTEDHNITIAWRPSRDVDQVSDISELAEKFKNQIALMQNTQAQNFSAEIPSTTVRTNNSTSLFSRLGWSSSNSNSV